MDLRAPQLAVQGGHPGRRCGEEQVGRERRDRQGHQGGEVAPEQRIVHAPEPDRDDQGDQEVRQVDRDRQRVVPMRGAWREQVLLQPHGGHVAPEQRLVGRDGLGQVRAGRLPW